MTYSADSPLLGVGTVAAEAIDAWFAKNGPSAAKTYAPDKTYKPAPVGLGAMIVRASRHWEADGAVADHNEIAADIAKESAFWQSAIVRAKNNPSGLGAENDDPMGKAVTFDTPYEGILATVAHWLTYAKGLGPWNAFDPRYEAVRARKWLGIAIRLRDLNGRWAWPGETYGQGIATLANQLVDFANHGTWEQEPPMTTVPKPRMNTSRPSPNRGGYDPAEDGPRVPEAIVNHIATGSKASNLNHLTNPASGASCNYYIAKDGEIFELVPWPFAAWTNGDVNKPDMSNPLIKRWIENGWNPNTRTITVEHEGEAADALTEAQIASNNALTAWLSQVAGIPISRATVLGHYQIDSVDRPYCPSFSDAEWRALIDGANALLNASQPQPEPAPTPDKLILPGQADREADGFPKDAGLERGFKGTLLAMGAAKYAPDPERAIVSIVGHLRDREEWTGTDGCVYQRCERVTLQYNPTLAAPWDIVFLLPHTPLPERKVA